MKSTRLEAFSDAVLGIVITLMALEIRPPEQSTFSSLWESNSIIFLSYILSFLYVGIYWNNHHQLLNAVEEIQPAALWANLNLLFWISLMPFSTSWVDESQLARAPLIVYGVNLLAAALSFLVLQRALMRAEPNDEPLKKALGRESMGFLGKDTKGKLSVILYVLGILSVASAPQLPLHMGTITAISCYILVALLWVIPDTRLRPQK